MTRLMVESGGTATALPPTLGDFDRRRLVNNDYLVGEARRLVVIEHGKRDRRAQTSA